MPAFSSNTGSAFINRKASTLSLEVRYYNNNLKNLSIGQTIWNYSLTILRIKE